jgi:hypothetical protein
LQYLFEKGCVNARAKEDSRCWVCVRNQKGETTDWSACPSGAGCRCGGQPLAIRWPGRGQCCEFCWDRRPAMRSFLWLSDCRGGSGPGTKKESNTIYCGDGVCIASQWRRTQFKAGAGSPPPAAVDSSGSKQQPN